MAGPIFMKVVSNAIVKILNFFNFIKIPITIFSFSSTVNIFDFETEQFLSANANSLRPHDNIGLISPP